MIRKRYSRRNNFLSHDNQNNETIKTQNTMKKLSLLSLALLLAGQMFATTWFVRADITSTEGDGQSWEGALCPTDFQKVLTGGMAEAGDVFHLAGGVYTPLSNTDIFTIKTSVTLIGGYPTDLKGTDTPALTYPSATPTVFSGDKNANGIADEGDLQHVVWIECAEPVVLQGIDIACCYFEIESAYGAGAVYVRNSANVVLRNCMIYNNKSVGNGGAGLTLEGGLLHLQDCNLHHNEAFSRGGALLMQTYTVDKAVVAEATCVAERCSFCYNSLATNSTDGRYGAAVQIRNGHFWGINTTIAKNAAYCNGAGISVSDVDDVHLISCTLGDNTCSRVDIDSNKPFAYGTSVRMLKSAKLWFVNTVMLEGEKDKGDKTNPTVYTEQLTGISLDTLFTSGGNNYLGTFNNGERNNKDSVWAFCWQTTDLFSVPAQVRHYADYFGTNLPTDNGGFAATILPLEAVEGATIADLEQLVQAWGCPVSVNVSLDARGYLRPSVATRGAMDPNANPYLAIAPAQVEKQAVKVMRNGQLLILSDGKYYNLLGTQVQ